MALEIYKHFTAQAFNIRALMGLFAILEKDTSPCPNVIPIVVFLAFSVESYINSIGARHVSIWNEVERLPWRKKIEILHKTVSRKANWGSQPLQFASEVFELRDKLAHGKPEKISIAPGEFASPGESIQPSWYAEINRDWVWDRKVKFRALMIYLAGLYGLHESDHLLSSYSGIELVPNA
jgi:hypothetical protein